MEAVKGVGDIYAAQGLKIKEAVDEDAMQIDDDAEMGQASASPRRRSSSSSSAIERSTNTFAAVMSAFLPPKPVARTTPTVADWFKEAGITGEQQAALLGNFPPGVTPTVLLLSQLEDPELDEAKLMPVQKRAFKKLQSFFNQLPPLSTQ